jgi:hypothetical protein
VFASLRALLSEVIDYAGMFPPARLSLDESICNYARYRQERESWMLGRFICPVARLAELEPYLEKLFHKPPTPFGISALGRGGNDTNEFVANLLGDQFAIDLFHAGFATHAVVNSFEVRLPGDFVSCPETPATDLTHIAKVTTDRSDGNCVPVMTYWEPTLGPDWRSRVSAAVHSLSADWIGRRYAKRRSTRPRGLKLRCGGVEPSAFPTAEQVAFTIAACRDAGVSLKFTAGLHHPLRRFEESVGTTMHGFVNVFGAGILAHAQRLSEGQIREIVEEENPGSFVFTKDDFRWKDSRATTEEIADARRQAVISFGSCSFDEPRGDLEALGWL